MNLYLIEQEENREWDTYYEAVVCAEDENTARTIDPSQTKEVEYLGWWEAKSYWCAPAYVKCKYLGKADESIKEGVICNSLKAG